MVRATKSLQDLTENTLVTGVAKVTGLDTILTDRQSLLIQADRIFGRREESTTFRATEAIFVVALAAHHQMALIQNTITTCTAWRRVTLLAEKSVTQESTVRGINVTIALATAITVLVEGAIVVFILVVITHRVATARTLRVSGAVVLALDHHKERRIERLGTILQLASETTSVPVGALGLHQVLAINQLRTTGAFELMGNAVRLALLHEIGGGVMWRSQDSITSGTAEAGEMHVPTIHLQQLLGRNSLLAMVATHESMLLANQLALLHFSEFFRVG